MKNWTLPLRLLVALVLVSAYTPYIASSDKWAIDPDEVGDWQDQENKVAERLESVQRVREQDEAIEKELAENPSATDESREKAVLRIITEDADISEALRQQREEERQAKEKADLEQALNASRDQAALDEQRAEREQQELLEQQELSRLEQERIEQENKARQDLERQEREEQELLRLLEQEKAVDKEAQAQKEREQKEQEERTLVRAEQERQQTTQREQEKKRLEDQEAQAVADALRQVLEFEAKAAQEQKTQKPGVDKPLSREEQELAAALAASLRENPVKMHVVEPDVEDLAAHIKQIEEMEQAALAKERKKNAPFIELYAEAIARNNLPVIKPNRPTIIQQSGLECGYYSAINAAIIYKSFQQDFPLILKDPTNKNINKLLLPIMTRGDLSNRDKIEPLLKQAQDYLGCEKTLDAGHITMILQEFYKIPLPDYSIYYEQLPTDLTRLAKEQVDLLEKIVTTPGMTHIFFLRKSGADRDQSRLGHWISVVAHNNDNKTIDLYVLDSQYDRTKNTALDQSSRMNHDKMWQALVILLHQARQKSALKP